MPCICMCYSSAKLWISRQDIKTSGMKFIRVNSRHRKKKIGDYEKTCYYAKLPKTAHPEDLHSKYLLKLKALKLLAWFIFALLLLISAVISLVYVVNHGVESETNDLYMPQKPIDNNTNIDSHLLITRYQWGGRPPKSQINITTPVDMVIIKHTAGRTCASIQMCSGIVQTLQIGNVHEGLPDIYCNFLIGGDGNIYEGRGFDIQPAYHNSKYDIVFLGTYDFDVPTPASLDAAKALIRYAVKINKLTKDYKVVNHNQVYETASPGLNIIKEVKKWPHYDPGLYFSTPLKIK